jgi:hypothetical protein
MGVDFLLVPLLAADQFGVESLARAMAIILPINTVGQTWFPYIVSLLREQSGEYTAPLTLVFIFALVGRAAMILIPPKVKGELHIPSAPSIDINVSK